MAKLNPFLGAMVATMLVAVPAGLVLAKDPPPNVPGAVRRRPRHDAGHNNGVVVPVLPMHPATGTGTPPLTTDAGTTRMDAGSTARADAGTATRVDSGTTTRTDAGTASTSTQPAAPWRVPSQHRTATTCEARRDPGNAQSSLTGPCHFDRECTQGRNGRCIIVRATNGQLANACSYDACAADSECGAGQVCACNHTAGGANQGNLCVAAGCRTDADCGAGAYCSPSPNACPSSMNTVTGFYCHRAGDACIENTDCGAGPNGARRCVNQAGRWTCVDPVCTQ